MPVTWSDEKLILLYCPGGGSNSRPSAHRSFKHGQGVTRPYSLGHGGGTRERAERKLVLESIESPSVPTISGIIHQLAVCEISVFNKLKKMKTKQIRHKVNAICRTRYQLDAYGPLLGFRFKDHLAKSLIYSLKC